MNNLKSSDLEHKDAVSPPLEDDTMSYIVSVAGTVLGISYPVLAFSTGGRAIYQLFLKPDVTDYLPAILSATAAFCYLCATIGFFRRQAWAWRLSVGVLGFETLLTLLIGTLSIIMPELIGRTVWRLFGIDYAFFPLIQPLLGLLWLFREDTRRAYGIRGRLELRD